MRLTDWRVIVGILSVMAVLVSGFATNIIEFKSPVCFDLDGDDDRYCSVKDAAVRAAELGCEGAHISDSRVMPCSTTSEYAEAVA